MQCSPAVKAAAGERVFGMDDIYIETCGQGWSWYGNIEHFELTRTRVFVQLSREAASRMSNEGKVETTFSLDDVAYAHLRNMLGRIFEVKVTIMTELSNHFGGRFWASTLRGKESA